MSTPCAWMSLTASRPVKTGVSPPIKPSVKMISTFWPNEEGDISVTLLGITTLSIWFPRNAQLPIEVTPSGMVILVSWFPKNAADPIEVTLSGMTTLVSWLSLNAWLPIEVTLSGMTTLWMPDAKNASRAIEVKVSGITMSTPCAWISFIASILVIAVIYPVACIVQRKRIAIID